MTRISTSLLPLWSKSPPEQGSLVSPHFPTNRSTPSPTPWSIRHSCHLQTTLQPPSPFPYALPPNLDRITHGHPPRDQQDRPTAPSNHPPRLSLRRRPRRPCLRIHDRVPYPQEHRSHPRVISPLRQTSTSPQVTGLPPSRRTQSEASTPCFTPHNPLHLRGIHRPMSIPLAKMYRKILGARYVNHSILRSPARPVEKLKSRTTPAPTALQQVSLPTLVVRNDGTSSWQ